MGILSTIDAPYPGKRVRGSFDPEFWLGGGGAVDFQGTDLIPVTIGTDVGPGSV